MTSTQKLHPIMKIMNNSLIDLPAPVNISVWWNYGSILGLFLVVQISTGILLSMHYASNTELAFFSLTHIMREVNWGWLLNTSHMNGASMFMLFMYLHMGRSIYYNSYYLMETWNIGVVIFVMTMATAFTGYVLPWGQMSFWGATVITNIFSAIPYFGHMLVEWLWGGFAVTNPTLNRFFSLRFIMPFIIAFLVALHFLFLHQSGSNNPLGVKCDTDRIPFHSYYTNKDLLGYFIVLLLFLTMILFSSNMLMDPENFMEANPLMTPTHIQPEWYFLWLYAILRSIPNKLGGVVALLAAFLILLVLPLTLPNIVSSSYNLMSQMMFYIMLGSWLILTWIGSCPVEYPYIEIGQMASLGYFSYFLMNPMISK